MSPIQMAPISFRVGGMTETLPPPVESAGHVGQHHRIVVVVATCALAVLAIVLLTGGGWALWKDRVDRDGSGFVSIGNNDLRTETHAIVGDLRGDGPGWFYGSSVLGDARVRATSPSDHPLFVGIARKDDVARYLRGAGYATIDNFEVRSDTTHAGGAVSSPPSTEQFWAASTEGTGQQTLRWTPRDGDWQIVFMNADAGSGVVVHGDASAKLPILPWLAVGLLAAGATAALSSAWLVRRLVHANRTLPTPVEQPSQPKAPVAVGAPT